MNKFVSFVSNAWTLFALSIIFFSLSVYVLTGLLVVWGIGFLIGSVIRFFAMDNRGNIILRQNDRY